VEKKGVHDCSLRPATGVRLRHRCRGEWRAGEVLVSASSSFAWAVSFGFPAAPSDEQLSVFRPVGPDEPKTSGRQRRDDDGAVGGGGGHAFLCAFLRESPRGIRIGGGIQEWWMVFAASGLSV